MSRKRGRPRIDDNGAFGAKKVFPPRRLALSSCARDHHPSGNVAACPALSSEQEFIVYPPRAHGTRSSRQKHAVLGPTIVAMAQGDYGDKKR
jgi:hypothetical protein